VEASVKRHVKKPLRRLSGAPPQAEHSAHRLNPWVGWAKARAGRDLTVCTIAKPQPEIVFQNRFPAASPDKEVE